MDVSDKCLAWTICTCPLMIGVMNVRDYGGQMADGNGGMIYRRPSSLDAISLLAVRVQMYPHKSLEVLLVHPQNYTIGWFICSHMTRHTFSKLANDQFRHQAAQKVGCQAGDCIWRL